LGFRIVLPHLPNANANPNKRSGYARNKKFGMYNAKLAKAKRTDREEVIATVLEQGRPDRPMEKAHITISWHAKDKRRRDIDNLFAAMKGSIDGLVDAGVIADDSGQCVPSYSLFYVEGCKKNETVLDIKEAI